MIIANIWIGIPFNLVVLYSGLQSIPGRLYEAAALDGATGWQRFWRVTFPLLRPVSAITLLLGLVYTLKVFDIIWIMTRGGPVDSSTTLRHLVLPARLRQPAARSSGPGAAVGNLLIVMALVFGLIYIRVQRRQQLHDHARATWWKTGIGAGPDRDHAVPGLLDDQRVVHPRPATCARARPTCSRSTAPSTATGRCSTSSCRTWAPACSSASAPSR